MLLRGARGGAGELRALGLVVGVGSSDGLGAAARTAVTAAVDAGRVDPDSPLGRAVAREGLDAAAVFRAADDGDPVALEVVDQLGDLLARVCVLLASLLDIDRVVVAGGDRGARRCRHRPRFGRARQRAVRPGAGDRGLDAGGRTSS
ncbi:ROK family protein [Curtobacterium sp. MCJR17_043]|uniref:ROK family protein n=1 Tax=Curtobacterium sp. MCJR17_043 TaxID=2175660 RepID=UPI0024DFB149|nr:ROK family protein [Curtobacterium sp. MCJR17_043]WIB35477.1 ROK family protein [Curtobacterium sp. MCJR17_043]